MVSAGKWDQSLPFRALGSNSDLLEGQLVDMSTLVVRRNARLEKYALPQPGSLLVRLTEMSLWARPARGRDSGSDGQADYKCACPGSRPVAPNVLVSWSVGSSQAPCLREGCPSQVVWSCHSAPVGDVGKSELV